MKQEFARFRRHYHERCHRALEREFARIEESPAPRLLDAMRYALFSSGKQVRPLLVYASARAVGSKDPGPAADAAACAVECIHAYSLIHDDLPAMDDDQLRRGRATCHVAFDEATAILAGDALQTLAFEVLSRYTETAPRRALLLLRELTAAAGAGGMAGGQALDMAATCKSPMLEELENLHRHKTGALLRACVRMGALATNLDTDPAHLQALDRYADCIGLAFQVQDDILDTSGDTAVMGKARGADAFRHKPTYVSLLGEMAAREKAAMLHREAVKALADFDENAQALRAIAAYIVERSK